MTPKDTQQRTFTTVSGVPVALLYTEESLPGFDLAQDLGEPGEAPYTRGIDPAMYRDHLWTMRQSGNSQAPLLRFGKRGITIESLADMETLLQDAPLLDTIDPTVISDAPATILWAMYLAVAEKQSVPWNKLRGTIQNDVLSESITRKNTISPRSGMKLAVDSIEFALREVPQWTPIAVDGYLIREAGSTALQELAFTLYNGIEYLDSAIRAGFDIDALAPRITFIFGAHNDLFEEIAKYRAARKIWHRVMTERFNCRDPKSAALRFHVQTAACSLTEQQPENNIVRVAIQALAAVLGGTQSLHTNAFDETSSLPTEQAARVALRTQQILAHESGVTRTVDPFGGSHFLERLTLDMERGCWEYFERLDKIGGMITAIEQSYPQREIEKASHDYQKAIEDKEKIVVGVNDFIIQTEAPGKIPNIDESAAGRPPNRDDRHVRMTLDRMREAATQGNVNMMPPILDCVRAYATLDEMCSELRAAYGAS